MKLNNQQVARAGEAFVVAEIHRRGGYATAFAGNMPAIDVVASDAQQARTVYLQVKTKTGRDWQTSIDRGNKREELGDEMRFWVLVDLGKDHPDYYIVPEWWIQNNIYETHAAYLNRQGGQRRHSPNSQSTTASAADACRSGSTAGSCSASSPAAPAVTSGEGHRLPAGEHFGAGGQLARPGRAARHHRRRSRPAGLVGDWIADDGYTASNINRPGIPRALTGLPKIMSTRGVESAL